MPVDLVQLTLIASPVFESKCESAGYGWHLRRPEDAHSVDAARQFDTGKLRGTLAFADGQGPEPLWCTIVWYDADQEPIAVYDTYNGGLLAVRDDWYNKGGHIAIASDVTVSALS